MTSQSGISETLNKLSRLSAEEVKKELDNLLPQLINCLKCCNEHPSTAVKVVRALFAQCLPYLHDLHEVESQILKPCLPAVHHILTEVFQLIKSRLDDVDKNGQLEDLQNLLQVCISLLESVEHCLNFFNTQGKVEITSAKIFVSKFNPIILVILHHFHKREEIYGSNIAQLAEYLRIFFKKTNDLLLKYFMTIKDVFIFNCAYADQLDILLEILVFLGQVGKVSPSMGMKAMYETWMVYATLTSNQKCYLSGHLEVADPLATLTTQISNIMLEATMQGMDEKILERKLKFGSSLLRVVIKLCEQFSGTLGDCHAALLELSLSLHRHSELGYELHATQSPSPLLDTCLAVGADPLLQKLITDQQFCKEVVLAKEGKSHLLLLLSISQQLVPLTPELRKPWLNSDSNIFYLIFSSVHYCQIRSDDKSLESTNPKVYKKLLSACTSLIAVLTREEVVLLENTMLKSISNGQTSCCQTLFVCDLWVILVKLAGLSFCLQHIEHLTNIVKHLPQGKQRLTLVSLVRRLLSLVPSKQRPVIQGIIELTLETSKDALPALEILQKFLNTPHCASSFKNMLNVLGTISVKGYDNVELLVSCVTKLWNFVDETYVGSLLSKKLLNASCMLISELDNKQFKIIISKFSIFTNPSLKLQCILFLTSLSKINFSENEHQQDLLQLIAKIYAYFLHDSNDLVQKTALHSFSEFVRFTTHEIIIKHTVHGSKELENMISNCIKNPTSSMDKLLLNKQLIALSMKEFPYVLDDQIKVPSTTAKVLNEDLKNEIAPEMKDLEKSETDHNQIDENIAKLLKDLNSNVDSIIELRDKSLLSPKSLIEIKKCLGKLSDICS